MWKTTETSIHKSVANNTQTWSGLPKAEHDDFMDVLNQIKLSYSQINDFLHTLQMQALNKARMYAVAEGFRQDSTTTIDALKRTQNNLLISTILAVVPTSAGTITIQIGDTILSYPSPTTGQINPIGLAYNVSHSSILRLTSQNAATGMYIGFFGSDLGNSGMVGALY